MSQAPERYTSPETRRRVAALANVIDDDWMQDWPLVELLQRADSDDDRFALMDLVLFSLDGADRQVQLV